MRSSNCSVHEEYDAEDKWSGEWRSEILYEKHPLVRIIYTCSTSTSLVSLLHIDDCSYPWLLAGFATMSPGFN